MTKGRCFLYQPSTSRKPTHPNEIHIRPTQSISLRTDAQFEEYLHTYLMPNASNTTLAQLMSYYPSDPSQGSPFDTEDLNALTPQFKRIAAILGDAVFQAPRRFFLQSQSGKQSIWSYGTCWMIIGHEVDLFWGGSE